MILFQKRRKEIYCSAMVRYFWCIVSMFVCLPPIITMCKTLRAQCISVWIWQILTVCMREAFLLCRNKQNGEVCERECEEKRESENRRQTNRQIKMDQQGDRQRNRLAANYWWQILFLFYFFASLRGLSLFYFHFIVLSWSLRLDVKWQIIWHLHQNITQCEIWHEF